MIGRRFSSMLAAGAVSLGVACVVLLAGAGSALACVVDTDGDCFHPNYHVRWTDGSLAAWTGPGSGHIAYWLGGNGTPVEVVCETTGAREDGQPYVVWDQLDDGTYVYGYYLDTPGDGYHPALAACSGPPRQASPAGGGGAAGAGAIAGGAIGAGARGNPLAAKVQSAATNAKRLVDEGGDGWGNPSTLGDHFTRHGGDFGSPNAKAYARQAQEFLQRAISERLPTKVGPDGTIRVYEPRTNTFGSYNSDGTTQTYFKPTARARYWERQPGDDPWAGVRTGGGGSGGGGSSGGDSGGTGSGGSGGQPGGGEPAGGDGPAPEPPDIPDFPDVFPDIPIIF